MPSHKRAPRSRTAVPAPRRVRHHVGFAVFASLLIGGMVIGLVTLNALLAQTSFRIDDLQTKLDGLADRHTVLTRQAAHLSAPGRIADWARRNGMRLPDDIEFLHVPATAGRSEPADRGLLDAEESQIRRILEAAG